MLPLSMSHTKRRDAKRDSADVRGKSKNLRKIISCFLSSKISIYDLLIIIMNFF